jgi:hypothetical protein
MPQLIAVVGLLRGWLFVAGFPLRADLERPHLPGFATL